MNLTVFFLCEESGTSGALRRARLGSKALWEIREMLVRAMHSELGSLSSLTLLFFLRKGINIRGEVIVFFLFKLRGSHGIHKRSWLMETHRHPLRADVQGSWENKETVRHFLFKGFIPSTTIVLLWFHYFNCIKLTVNCEAYEL